MRRGRGPRRAAPPAVLTIIVVMVAVGPVACSKGSGGGGGAKIDEPLVLRDRVVPVAELERGHEVYDRLCRSCHGERGDGQGPAASSLKVPPRDFRTGQFRFSEDGDVPLSHEALVAAIREGAPGRGMPSWGALPAEDLDAVANYIKAFSPRWLRMEDGDLRGDADPRN